MTENQIPTADDVEGHGFSARGHHDEPTETDTDDVEGHGISSGRDVRRPGGHIDQPEADPDDTEGHGFRVRV
jgi:hypothetical protein